LAQTVSTASSEPYSTRAPVTFSDSAGRLAMASCRTGPPRRTISLRSSSVNTGEKFSSGSEIDSTSRASFTATS